MVGVLAFPARFGVILPVFAGYSHPKGRGGLDPGEPIDGLPLKLVAAAAFASPLPARHRRGDLKQVETKGGLRVLVSADSRRIFSFDPATGRASSARSWRATRGSTPARGRERWFDDVIPSLGAGRRTWPPASSMPG
jgi:hypothetical protein